MRSSIFTGASALVLLAASVQAKHGTHDHLEAIHRRHRHERELARHVNETLVKRGVCAFPTDAGLIAVTPQLGNGGWAFASDQSCTVGRYCPYACPPGQVSMQWDPSVTSYVYPGSRNGGLLCNSDGTVSKPYPSRPYCQSTTANIGFQNSCGGQNIAVCQTVLPGDEDMLIPTDVTLWTKIAVPDTTYWAGTAAHYYINPPGVSSTQGCVWGSNANPYGNWAPYVAGANSDATGMTYIKLGWNPIYLEPTTPFRNQMPTWGVKIDCPNGGCVGLPCSIDPTKNKVNEMTGSSSIGAGGGSFCVVTVAKGSKANFIVFNSDDDNDNVSTTKSIASSSTASATASVSGWGNVKGGQFYQSNTVSASTSSTAPSSTTTSSNSTSSDDSDDTSGPSGKPYYQLFNTSSTSETTQSAKLSSTTSAVVAQHTGGASSIGLSSATILLAFGAMFL